MTMSWVALTTARSTAIRPIASRLAWLRPGLSRAMAPITATSRIWRSSNQPRRRSGQGIGQRSSSGAQTILRV